MNIEDNRLILQNKKKSLFLVFSGGGAKGFAHIAALKSIEDQNCKIEGVAGTSAGAIIAALVAVGWRADEIAPFESEVGSSPSLLLEKLNMLNVIDVLGQPNWMKLKLLKNLGRGIILIEIFLLVLAYIISSYVMYSHSLSITLNIFLVLSLIFAYFFVRELLTGVCSTEPVRDAINQALVHKMSQTSKGKALLLDCKENVTFKALKEFDGSLPLRIVVTDLTTKKIKLFSSEATPDVYVADAVAASLAIPIIFQPPTVLGVGDWSENTTRYFDGGLVSNTPSWAFDLTRRFYPAATIISVELDSQENADKLSPITKLIYFLFPAKKLLDGINAAVFGTGAIHRTCDANETLPIRPLNPNKNKQLELLDFDIDRTDLFEILKAVKSDCDQIIQNVIEHPPAHFLKWSKSQICQEIKHIGFEVKTHFYSYHGQDASLTDGFAKATHVRTLTAYGEDLQDHIYPFHETAFYDVAELEQPILIKSGEFEAKLLGKSNAKRVNEPEHFFRHLDFNTRLEDGKIDSGILIPVRFSNEEQKVYTMGFVLLEFSSKKSLTQLTESEWNNNLQTALAHTGMFAAGFFGYYFSPKFPNIDINEIINASNDCYKRSFWQYSISKMVFENTPEDNRPADEKYPELANKIISEYKNLFPRLLTIEENRGYQSLNI